MRPTTRASSRTRGRIREHPGLTVQRTAWVGCIGSRWRHCALCASPDGWLGWLPLDEIDTTTTES